MQKLHLVMGGRVKDPQHLEFTDLTKIDLVGVYPDYASAEEAWRSCARWMTRKCATWWSTSTACSSPSCTSQSECKKGCGNRPAAFFAFSQRTLTLSLSKGPAVLRSRLR